MSNLLGLGFGGCFEGWFRVLGGHKVCLRVELRCAGYPSPTKESTNSCIIECCWVGSLHLFFFGGGGG